MSDDARTRKLSAERACPHRQRNRLPWRPRMCLTAEIEEHQSTEALLEEDLVSLAESEDRVKLADVAGEIIRSWQKAVTRDASEPAA